MGRAALITLVVVFLAIEVISTQLKLAHLLGFSITIKIKITGYVFLFLRRLGIYLNLLRIIGAIELLVHSVLLTK